jgi:hypothetical protein
MHHQTGLQVLGRSAFEYYRMDCWPVAPGRLVLLERMDWLQRLAVKSDQNLTVQMPAFQRRTSDQMQKFGPVLKVGQMQKPGLVVKAAQRLKFDLVVKVAQRQKVLLALMSAQMQTLILVQKAVQRQMWSLVLKAVQRQMWSLVLKTDQRRTAGPKRSLDPTQSHLQTQMVFQMQNLRLEQRSDQMHPQA